MNKSRKPTKRSSAWRQGKRGNTVNTSIKGRNTLRIPNEPPGVNPAPWSALTLARIFTAGQEPFANGLVQSSDIANWMFDQLDPDKKYLPRNTDGTAKEQNPIYFKIESVMAWNLTGKTIALNVYDFSTDDVHKNSVGDEDYESLGSWFDSCSGNTPPKCGFQWPTNNRAKILSNHKNATTEYGEGLRHICTLLAPKNDQVMVHFRLFWRFPASGKEMLKNIIGVMEIHSAVERLRTAAEAGNTQAQSAAASSLAKQNEIFAAMPNKFLGAVPVWVENKVIPASSSGSLEEIDGQDALEAEIETLRDRIIYLQTRKTSDEL